MFKKNELYQPFYKNKAKVIICRKIRDKIRKEIRYMYRSAEVAFGDIDFTG